MDPPAPSAAQRSGADRLADAVSVASDFGAIWVAVAIAQVVLGRSSAPRALVRLKLAGLASLVLTRVLKHHFAVERDPDAAEGSFARTPSSSRFPSGHTLAAFTSAIAIPTSTKGRGAAVCLAALVAWARVRVGHHRPEDVLAGAAVGAAAGAAIVAVLSVLDAR